jgi:hypothetical protein
MKNKMDTWMENLVKNYQLPKDEPNSVSTKILTESQKKIILGKK